MKKIVTVVGARPQFIKATVVSAALSQCTALQEIILHTGQHYDDNMSKVFLDELGIPALNYQLHVRATLHGEQTADMLKGIESVLIRERPDWVLVYGDTNSTLAGALAAVKLHIPVAHVEAGLRSYNNAMPEEINRIVTDRISSALFAPTSEAVANLEKEGIAPHLIHATGDVMYDASLFYAAMAQKKSRALRRLGISSGQYILATIHRAENTDNNKRLLDIFSALARLASEMPVILPLHPRTRKKMNAIQGDLLSVTPIKIIEPASFMDMLVLEQNAALIVTDSGGIQKEAFFYQIPCVTLRDETEWVETVRLGWNKVVCPDQGAEEMTAQMKAALGRRGISGIYPYGTGNAGEKIADFFGQARLRAKETA